MSKPWATLLPVRLLRHVGRSVVINIQGAENTLSWEASRPPATCLRNTGVREEW